MKHLFLSGVPEKLVIGISEKNNYVAKVSRELGFTYSHITKIVQKLETQKLITKTKEGRKIKIKLTKKGEKLQEHLMGIRRLIT